MIAAPRKALIKILALALLNVVPGSSYALPPPDDINMKAALVEIEIDNLTKESMTTENLERLLNIKSSAQVTYQRFKVEREEFIKHTIKAELGLPEIQQQIEHEKELDIEEATQTIGEYPGPSDASMVTINKYNELLEVTDRELKSRTEHDPVLVNLRTKIDFLFQYIDAKLE